MRIYLIAALVWVSFGQASSPPNPYDGRAWHAMAAEQLSRGDAGGAVASLRKAIELGAVAPADGLVEIAAAHAAGGDLSAAAARLREAVAAGYRFRAGLARDARFSSLPPQTLAELAGTMRTAEAGTAAARLADLEFLVSEVRRLHPRFASGDPETFGRRLDTLRRALPAMDDVQAVVGMQRLLASAGDGHTLVYPFGMNTGALTRVQATLYWFEEGLFVVDASDSSLRGAQLVAIDGEPVEVVLERLRPSLSVDNEMQFRWAAPLYLTFPAFTSADATQKPGAIWSVVRDGTRTDVTVQHVRVDPAALETKLPAPPGVAAPRFLARRSEHAWFEPLDARALFVQVNAIVNADTETLAAFAQRLSTELRSGRWDAAVVDLRNNSGGDASLADPLLRALVSFEEGGGRLMVLAGRFTFSAAQTLAARLDAWTGAVFGGEPTGSRVNRYGNEAPFRLPHSGVRGTISSGWNQPVTSRDHRVWIAPDIPVAFTARDYFAGVDPVLERARAELRLPR